MQRLGAEGGFLANFIDNHVAMGCAYWKNVGWLLRRGTMRRGSPVGSAPLELFLMCICPRPLTGPKQRAHGAGMDSDFEAPRTRERF